MKHIKFPSIDQFRNVVYVITKKYEFKGLDENQEPIYDETLPKPIITFKGTVKLHGTNAGVCFNNGNLWFQSRENIIIPQNDNAGFAFFGEKNRIIFLEMFNEIIKINKIDAKENTISIFGEWCGKGVQSKVGISNLQKSFFIFAVKITPPEGFAYWIEFDYLKSPQNNIYNINDYKTFSIDIDFNHPELVQEKIVDLTIEVELECPVAKALGFDNTVGEGIVFVGKVNDDIFRFKSKGELHAKKPKKKKFNGFDDEKKQKIINFAEQVTPIWRLEQMLESACDFMNGGTLDRKKIGTFIKLVVTDVMKEDLDLIIKSELEPKEITSYISEIAKNYFFEQEKFKIL